MKTLRDARDKQSSDALIQAELGAEGESRSNWSDEQTSCYSSAASDAPPPSPPRHDRRERKNRSAEVTLLLNSRSAFQCGRSGEKRIRFYKGNCERREPG